MSIFYIMKKKAEIVFIDDESVHHRGRLDTNAEDESIKRRTRSATKGSNSTLCTPSTSSKNRMSTPSTRTPRTRITPTTNTPLNRKSARIARSSVNPNCCRKLPDDSPACTPSKRVSVKIVLPSLNGEKGANNKKVTPLKISVQQWRRTSVTDESSASEDDTPKSNVKGSPFIRKLDLSDEDVFKTTPSKNNTSTKKSVYGLRTPKTPQFHTPVPEINGETPKTGSVRRKRTILRTPSTPSSARALFTGNSVPKTPHATRSRIKKQIQAKKLKEEEDEFDSEVSEIAEDSEDEYEPNTSDEQSSNHEEESPTKKTKILGTDVSASPRSTVYNFRAKKKVDYQKMVMLDTDKYFEKKSQKIISSNNALSALSTPNITESDVNEIVSKNYVKHRKEIVRLMEQQRQQFDKWLFYLKEGFNLIMYGIGSKVQILKLFQKEKLNQSHVLTINGFHTGFAITEMFKVLINNIFKATHCPTNINDALIAVKEELEKNEFPVFIIINNIDGIALRGNKQQTILSKLAELPNIHIIATVDHINAPLLWGNNKMSAFNFLWLDVTTFCSYSVETSFENSFEIGKLCSDSSLVTLNNVFKSAETKSKEIFKLIVKDYLKNRNNKEFKGILLVELARLAKKDLLVTSEYVLKTHLNYFVNYEIIKMRGDYVQLLPSANVINMFYKQRCRKDDDDDED